MSQPCAFLCTVSLERDWVQAKLPFQGRPHKLSTVLSSKRMTRFLAKIPDCKMRAVLVTAYAAGPRVPEVVALRVRDVDNQRMVLRIAEGKGGRERPVMLSPKLLDLLRVCWTAGHPPSEWAVSRAGGS
jgi:integrase/recombinase XerD